MIYLFDIVSYLHSVFSAEFLCIKSRTVDSVISEFAGSRQQRSRILWEHTATISLHSDGLYQHGITGVLVRLELWKNDNKPNDKITRFKLCLIDMHPSKVLFAMDSDNLHLHCFLGLGTAYVVRSFVISTNLISHCKRCRSPHYRSITTHSNTPLHHPLLPPQTAFDGMVEYYGFHWSDSGFLGLDFGFQNQ